MTPRIVVLLATLDGMPWVRVQVEGILGQEGVEVRVVVSDDGSTDGTAEYLAGLAAANAPVTVLPRRAPGGASAQNFLHLIPCYYNVTQHKAYRNQPYQMFCHCQPVKLPAFKHLLLFYMKQPNFLPYTDY